MNILSSNFKTDIPNFEKLEVENLYLYIKDLNLAINIFSKYTYLHMKTPINFDVLAQQKRVDISGFLTLETVEFNMGESISGQKKRFCRLFNSPESPDNVSTIREI